MSKYLLHVLIITFVFFLTPAIQSASGVEEDIEAYKQAIRIDPDYVKAHYNLGTAYADLDMYKEAIESYKHAIRIDPDFTNAHFNLGLAYVLSNDRDSALDQYKTLKSLDSELANKLFKLNN